MLLALTSCTNSKLKTMVDDANKDCPLSMGEMGEVSSITLEGENVVFSYSIDEQYVDIDALSENGETIKSSIISALSQSSKEMFVEMDKENAGLVLNLVGKTSKKTCTLKISPEECKSILKSINDGTSDTPIETLKKQIEATNVQLPMTIEEGLVLYEMTLEGDYAVYNYNVDESMYDINTMEQNKEQTKAEIKAMLTSGSDMALEKFVKSCKNANKGIAYKYIGSNSGKSYQINFPISEL